MIDHPVIAKTARAIASFAPTEVIQSRLHKRVFTQFAEKVGFVYFGYVDQRSDDHSLVRGLTVSASHRDNHYCIGSFGGYDIALVERVDTIRFPHKPAKHHNWIVMTFDLHTNIDVPHIFIGLHAHSETFYAHLFTKFPHLVKIPSGTLGTYDSAFTHRYAMYTDPAHIITTEQLFNQEATKIIAEQFGSLTIEVSEGCLYVYAQHQRPSVTLLERMLKQGLWLARTIDERIK